MKKLLWFAELLVIFIFLSCYNNPGEPEVITGVKGTYKLTGYVTYDGKPLEGADVQVSNNFNWRTKTGPDGKFVLEGLIKGEHLFSIGKIFIDKRKVSQAITVILIDETTSLGEIRFPAAPDLFNLDESQLDNNKIILKWSRSDPDEFLEYKVYRTNQPDIDDKNSDLVYSTSSNSDTQCIDYNIRTGMKYYYRVYAYYSNYKSGASNPESVEVPEFNIILNAGFENAGDGINPDNWFPLISGNPGFRYFEITGEEKRTGSRSLKIYFDDAHANPLPGHNAWGGLMQSVSKNYLIEGKEYTLSFWAKAVNGSFQVRLVRNSNLEDPVITYIVPDKTDWSEQRFTFTVDQANYYELWISVRPGLSNNGTVTGYLDDFKLLR